MLLAAIVDGEVLGSVCNVMLGLSCRPARERFIGEMSGVAAER